jgi:hypothetical protein
LDADPGETPDQAAADVELGKTVAALTADDIEPAARRQLLGRLAEDIRRRGFGQMFRPRAALRWMADVVADVAPHVPIRDRETLHRHFPGLSDDDLAERLIRNASRTTAGMGAVGGGVAAVQWVVTPTLLTAPVLLAAETVAVVAVELKLIGELHEVYGQPIRGGMAERALALLQGWSNQRGVNPLLPGRHRSWHDRSQRAAEDAAAPLRAQPDHARPAAHRRRGGRLSQPTGHPERRRAHPERPAQDAPQSYRGLTSSRAFSSAVASSTGRRVLITQ